MECITIYQELWSRTIFDEILKKISFLKCMEA